VWLDRGELDKIIEKSSIVQTQAEPARGHHEHHDHKHYDHKHYRKKSIWHEIFD
jgi:Zn-finger nucleic acid-binding protein